MCHGYLATTPVLLKNSNTVVGTVNLRFILQASVAVCQQEHQLACWGHYQWHLRPQHSSSRMIFFLGLISWVSFVGKFVGKSSWISTCPPPSCGQVGQVGNTIYYSLIDRHKLTRTIIKCLIFFSTLISASLHESHYKL